MMTLTEDQKAGIVDAAIEQIRAQAIADATGALAGYVRNAVSESLYVEVQAIVQAEIVPALREELLMKKPVLIEGAVMAASTMADQIARAMAESLAKKLETEWGRKGVFEALFGR